MSEYRFMNQLTEKEQIPTPAYVFDLDEMKEFAEKVKRCLTGKAEICYAMKANPFLIKSMMEIVSSLEVCSPGEFRICERAGIPMEKIVLSGVYKNPDDIAYMLDRYGNSGTYTVESLQHLKVLNDTAVRHGIILSVLIRVTSGNQFGIDEAEIRKIISEREKYAGIEIEGIQFYSGTQKRNLSQMQEENGAFSSWGTESSESVSQVLTALTELGLSLDDARFVKNGQTLEDVLLRFAQDDGSFAHTPEDGGNLLATTQAFYALTALQRARDGKPTLYDMSDVTP